jgi:hypothetical protein
MEQFPGGHCGRLQQQADPPAASEPAGQGLLPLLPVPAEPALPLLGPGGGGGQVHQLLLCRTELSRNRLTAGHQRTGRGTGTHPGQNSLVLYELYRTNREEQRLNTSFSILK